MEVSLRHSFPVLSSRLREKLTVRVGRTDHVVYSDALYKLETKTKAEGEKMSQSEKDVMKATNDSLSDDNKLLKSDRVKAMDSIFSTISADSQNTLDTWIKQNHQQHWFLLQPDFQFMPDRHI